MAERPNAPVLKTGEVLSLRGFKSHLFRTRGVSSSEGTPPSFGGISEFRHRTERAFTVLLQLRNDAADEQKVFTLIGRPPLVGAAPRARLGVGEVLDSVGFKLFVLAILVSPSALAIGSETSRWSLGFASMNNVVDPVIIAIGLTQLVPITRELLPAHLTKLDSRTRQTTVLFAAFVLWATVAWIVHPRAYGMFLILRLIGVAGISRLVRNLASAQRRTVTRAFVGVTAFNALACIGQLALNRALGLYLLGELPYPFMATKEWRVPYGISMYPYAITVTGLLCVALLVVARNDHIGRWWTVSGAAGAGIILGCSGSVSGLATLVALLASCCIFAGRNGRAWRGLAIVLVPFLLALGTACVAQRGVWLWKGNRTVSVESGQATSGRSGQMRVALKMTSQWPVTGVGPGGFMRTRLSNPEYDLITPDRQITHSLPLLVMAELGIPGLGLLVLTFLRAGVGRMRNTLLLPASLSGYLLADFMHWYRGMGLLQLGVVLGFMLVQRDPDLVPNLDVR